MLALECRLEFVISESFERCFFNRFLTALRVLDDFFETVLSCSSSMLDLSSSKIAWMAAASSRLERRDPELHAGKDSWDLAFNLNIGGDATAGRGATPSGEGGCRLKQQAAELMVMR